MEIIVAGIENRFFMLSKRNFSQNRAKSLKLRIIPQVIMNYLVSLTVLRGNPMTTARLPNILKVALVLPAFLFLFACSSAPKKQDAAEETPATAEAAPAAPAEPAAITVSLQAAMQGLVSNPSRFSYQYSGWVETAQNTISGNGSLEYSASEPVVVDNKTVTKQSTSTLGTILMKGVPREIKTVVVSYHDPATFASVLDESNGVYAVYSPYEYPKAVKAGDKGVLTRSVLYRDATKAEQLGSFDVSYSVEGNPQGPLVINLVTDRYDNARTLTQTGSISFLATVEGKVQPIKGRSVGYPVNGQAPYEIFNTYVTGN